MTTREPRLLVRDVEIGGVPGLDCRIENGRIAELGRALRPAAGGEALDGRGGPLIAGLADHHIHLAALAAWRESVDLTGVPPAAVPDRLRRERPNTCGWVRAVGYDEAVHGDLDRDALDTFSAPVRVQHRSGALWVLNSAALGLVGAEDASHPGVERDQRGRLTGRLWRADDWLRERVPGRTSLRAIGSELASYGITHVSDATPDSGGTGARLLGEAIVNGELQQHVAIMSAVLPPVRHRRLITGPVKLVVADHDPPDLDRLVADICASRAQDRPVAVHCVTRQAIALTLAALDVAGHYEGDRIEHCAVADLATARVLADRRITVVTQPTLPAMRGDEYRRRVDSADLPDLWRYGSLRRAGVPVAPSSDAPYGDPNPWACVRAADDRRTPSGHVLGPAERVPAEVALAGMQTELTDPGGTLRTVRDAAGADLVLLDRPLAAAVRDGDPGCVVATIIDGRLVYRRDG